MINRQRPVPLLIVKSLIYTKLPVPVNLWTFATKTSPSLRNPCSQIPYTVLLSRCLFKPLIRQLTATISLFSAVSLCPFAAAMLNHIWAAIVSCKTPFPLLYITPRLYCSDTDCFQFPNTSLPACSDDRAKLNWANIKAIWTKSRRPPPHLHRFVKRILAWQAVDQSDPIKPLTFSCLILLYIQPSAHHFFDSI